MIEELEKLNTEVKQGGFVHKLIQRDDRKCLYEKTQEGIPMGYEVFKTKITDRTKSREYFAKLNGKEVDYSKPVKAEVYPNDEEFGVRAWFYPNLSLAKEAYERLLA